MTYANCLPDGYSYSLEFINFFRITHMAPKNKEDFITIDGKKYDLKKLPKQAQDQVLNIKFCDQQLQRLNNELAVADTARIGYGKALDKEIQTKK